jgi:RNA polymerase sigma-70 factor, ECF subfamily
MRTRSLVMISPLPENAPQQPAAVRAVPETGLVFADVYESQFSFVWRCALRLGAPADSVDDIVQETFIVVHRRLAEFEGRSTIKTWLFGIAANIVRAHRRVDRVNQLHNRETSEDVELERVADTNEGPHEIATRAEAVLVLDRLLDELDDDKREVFVLAELEQMSAPEIAQAIGVPLNTVYSRLRLARESFAAAAARHRARDGWRVR